MRPIALSGFMGAGKTTVGARLARLTGRVFVDLDREIEAAFARDIPTIFDIHGEPAFRAMEARLLRQALARPDRVIAMGGGAVLDGDSRRLLEDVATWVHLDVPLGELRRRVVASGGDTGRPLWDEDKAEVLLASRQPVYADATLTVDGSRPAPEVAEAVLAALQDVTEEAPAGPVSPVQRLRVDVPGAPYDVIVGRSLDSVLTDEVGAIGAGPIALLTDWNVGPLHAAKVEAALQASGRSVVTVTLPAGEDRKDVRGVLDAVDRLLDTGWQRTSPVVALGGGVLGDMAGLAATLVLRGVPFVQVPTTLLAMVDSSVGGKVGVNHRSGKNLIGAFTQPALVVADLGFLDTLPDRELRAGLAEAAKSALLGDLELLQSLEQEPDRALSRDPEYLSDLVVRCARFKASVVAEDERERGRRRILNLGHTIGHAIEVTAGYGRLLHGEAVSIGMVAAAEIGADLGVSDASLAGRIRALLVSLGLPTTAPPLSLEALAKAVHGDKKLEGPILSWVLLGDVGRPTVHGLPIGELNRQLAYLVRVGVLSNGGE